MTTIQDIFKAFAPEYLERYPHLPLSHQKTITAIQHCQRGHYGHSLYQCQSCGGLSKDRTQWRPSRDNFFVPVKALSSIYRAIFKQQMAHAGLLERIDPKVWNIVCNVHSQANPNGATSFKYLAPYVFKVAISNSRLVSLKDRTVTFTYRKPGSSRPRTTQLDATQFIRRFLQHVLPEGFQKVRHFGFMNSRCAIPIDTLRQLIWERHPVAFKTPEVEALAPLVASCPTCGKPMQLVRRLWTSNRVFLDTG